MESDNQEGRPDDLREWSVGPDDPTRVSAEPDSDEVTTVLPGGGPAELGGNHLVRLVGRGGMGEVWLAVDPRLQRQVAIKLMAAGLAGDPLAVQRFYREARAVARLNHPNIVQIHQIGEENGAPFFAMEWVDGETLSEKLRREGPLPLAEALRILSAAVDALDYACGNGVVHRDIKPGNMLLDRSGRVKLADFGLAKLLDGDAGQTTATGVPMGSPNYMSPEQAKGEPADHRSDIYSLGITLYQMLTGQLPHSGSTPVTILLKHLQEPLPEPEPLKALAGGAVMQMIRTMTAKAAGDRFSTYEELKGVLGQLAASASTVGALPGNLTLPGSSRWDTKTSPMSLPAGEAAAGTTGAGGPGKEGAAARGVSWRTVLLLTLVALLAGGAAGVALVGYQRMNDSRRRKAVAQQTSARAGKGAASKGERAAAAGGAAGRDNPAASDPAGAEAAPPEGKGEGAQQVAPLPPAPPARPAGPPMGRGGPAQRLRKRINESVQDNYRQALSRYDFAESARIMEQMMAAGSLPADKRIEANNRLEQMRTLAGIRKAVEAEAARRTGTAVRVPGRGLMTLAGTTPDGFQFRDNRGEFSVAWSELKPVEVLALVSQLVPQESERGLAIAVLKDVFPTLAGITVPASP